MISLIIENITSSSATNLNSEQIRTISSKQNNN